MLKEVVCAEIDELLDASFGDAKSNLNRFGPGLRWTNILKCES